MSQNINDSDKIKNPQNLFNPDLRSDTYFKTRTISDYFEWMAGADLNEKVPEELKIAFDIARNVFLYSFYSTRMCMAAQLQAFAVLEYALNVKLDLNPNLKEDKNHSLSELLKIAIKERWIDDSILPSDWRNSLNEKESIERCLSLQEYWAPSTSSRKITGTKGLRNTSFHEPIYLDLPRNISDRIIEMACIINKLFKN